MEKLKNIYLNNNVRTTEIDIDHQYLQYTVHRQSVEMRTKENESTTKPQTQTPNNQATKW